ncbi:hypothetical protein AJ79_06547 [Helicocarpus griseus UAMH5409]|uniref:Uncharacterized protein n=1 Tax=Helicocarpus griseus UAMH5409 TaxID=1447875 RepID=A0A2B7XCT2_9EURO|nr:hypothetical protein AJ79_06547 [Helicocarpus griseus UAMH5409]
MADQGDQAPSPTLPETRDPSRSPSLSPTPAISSCPSPDRTFSTVSSISNFSGDARSSVSTSSRRRGYIRPQGVVFAESAKNRESVMSLGSIAHLQYYFARTGLLDGKGAQFAKTDKKKGEQEGKQQPQDIPRLLLTTQPQLGEDLVESPIDDMGGFDGLGDDEWDGDEPVMLPPTVSTYSIRNHYIPPPPDLESLRRDLQTALEKARFVLTATKEQLTPQLLSPKPRDRDRSPDGLSETEDEASGGTSETPTATKPRGWHEIEGMHILDMVTLAIRAAKIYYTAHENPDRLATIKSERKIREELLQILDVLKRWATRNFAGGMKDEERGTILDWIKGVGEMLEQERRLEERELQRRSSYIWANGEWDGREHEQAGAFLQCLETSNRPLPAWDNANANSLPTPLLERLKDGRDLVRFHNEAVKLSRRHFGQIKSYHEDVGKPYRLAENLRFWIKAAEIRWEIKLDVDVMGVVNNEADEAWKKFDAALMAWCKGVREELVRDWKEKSPHATAPASPADPAGLPSPGLGIGAL